MTNNKTITRALISVSDKTGIVELAKILREFNVEIISTGGTAKALRAADIPVTDVSDVTGFPEMMDGRVKTLHPKIHGAFLALRDNPKHIEAMKTHKIEAIDLVVVNLYPFQETIEKQGVSLEEAIEQIDIGGPAMIRSASKNWRDVAVVTDPKLYHSIIDEIQLTAGSLSHVTRKRLAALAFTRTSFYDLTISGYLAENLSQDDLEYLDPLNPFEKLSFIEDVGGQDEEDRAISGGMADSAEIELKKLADLRYGENPHQAAAIYSSGKIGGLVAARQLHGKEMSFNNYIDAESAWQIVSEFDERAVAIIKHTNPSGVGLGESNFEAHQRALATDPVSAFGGIVALNRKVDAPVAEAINEVFTEVVIAPDFEEDAFAILSKKKNLRILRMPNTFLENTLEYKQISGGFLVQDADKKKTTEQDFEIVTKRKPTDTEVKAMILAWKVCKNVKSNAIVFASDIQTVGVGAGQMNRVDSVRIAAMRAHKTDLKIEGAALASDAFFPFRDNVDEAAKIGISAIIQPGGSKRDQDSIDAADKHSIAMVFTGIRHFKH